MNTRSLPLLLRLCAAIIAIAAVVLFAVQFRDAKLSGAPISWPALLFPAVITIALSLILAGIGDVISYANTTPDELSRSVGRMQQQIADLQKRVDDVAVATDRMSRNRTPPPQPPPMNVMAQIPAGSLDPILKAIGEVREMALLTDAERHERLKNLEQDRKRMLVRQVIEHIEHARWSDAGTMLDTLDREHPGDVEIRRTRGQFEDMRRKAETLTVHRTREQVDNYIGIGAWDQAYQSATRLVEDFPGSTEAQNLLSRVSRERDIHIETSVARMVDEIRHDIDRRLWRRALMHAQRLVDRFAEHPKTQRILEQLGTLQENAEIEERQELEVRIQELIRGRQFQEAIDLSEEMLNRFPESPQAEAIERLLPRIRELAAEPEAPAAS